MSDAKRPWFQIHLSTLMALTVTASIFLWANILPPTSRPIEHDYVAIRGRGWPISGFRATAPASGAKLQAFILGLESRRDIQKDQWLAWSLNALIALAILTAVGFALEWRVRKQGYKIRF